MVSSGTSVESKDGMQRPCAALVRKLVDEDSCSWRAEGCPVEVEGAMKLRLG